MPEDTTPFSDVVCSVCERHNREVRVVATKNGLILCQVCVAKCAAIFDEKWGSTRRRAAGSAGGR